MNSFLTVPCYPLLIWDNMESHLCSLQQIKHRKLFVMSRLKKHVPLPCLIWYWIILSVPGTVWGKNPIAFSLHKTTISQPGFCIVKDGVYSTNKQNVSRGPKNGSAPLQDLTCHGTAAKAQEGSEEAGVHLPRSQILPLKKLAPSSGAKRRTARWKKNKDAGWKSHETSQCV